jgi:thymidylate synthase (FAD)
VKAELLGHFGDDLMVVNAARVSYGKSKSSMDEKDVRLISYLVRHGHTSPFRHPQLQYRISCPIFVERQLFKHQVGLTANSISGRYVDFSDEYWKPSALRAQSKDSKQGSSGPIDPKVNADFLGRIDSLLESCKKLYEDMERSGVAKEQCRIVLPLCLETQFVWTGSLAAFLHLWRLRLKEDAQQETREVAGMMLDELRNLPDNPFKFTLEAFGL